MCLSTVWTAERQPVCKNVASVTQKDGQLVFTDIMGIPTVVDGETLAFDLLYRPEGTSEESMEQLRQMFQPQGRSMMVTPREVDQMVERGAKLISMAINLALQPDLSAEEITYLLA